MVWVGLDWVGGFSGVDWMCSGRLSSVCLHLPAFMVAIAFLSNVDINMPRVIELVSKSISGLDHVLEDLWTTKRLNK